MKWGSTRGLSRHFPDICSGKSPENCRKIDGTFFLRRKIAGKIAGKSPETGIGMALFEATKMGWAKRVKMWWAKRFFFTIFAHPIFTFLDGYLGPNLHVFDEKSGG